MGTLSWRDDTTFEEGLAISFSTDVNSASRKRIMRVYRIRLFVYIR